MHTCNLSKPFKCIKTWCRWYIVTFFKDRFTPEINTKNSYREQWIISYVGMCIYFTVHVYLKLLINRLAFSLSCFISDQSVKVVWTQLRFSNFIDFVDIFPHTMPYGANVDVEND